MSQNPYENNPYDKNPGNGQNQQPQNQNPYEQQGAQYQQDPYGQPQPGAVSADDKNMAFLMNLISAGATFLSATTIGFLAPLIFWFIYKDKPGPVGYQHGVVDSGTYYLRYFDLYPADCDASGDYCADCLPHYCRCLSK